MSKMLSAFDSPKAVPNGPVLQANSSYMDCVAVGLAGTTSLVMQSPVIAGHIYTRGCRKEIFPVRNGLNTRRRAPRIHGFGKLGRGGEIVHVRLLIHDVERHRHVALLQ